MNSLRQDLMDAVHAFIQALRRSQLLLPAQVAELKARLLAEPRNLRAVADQLVQRGWLSAYQVEQILTGNEQELVIGPYRVLALLGEGGLCQVFKAWDTARRREVGLKVIHSELREKPEVLEQFQNEARVMAGLSHPSFVKALDSGKGEPLHYFAMEYVEGIDLSRLLKLAGPLPVPQASFYVRQAALGLQYAFEQGLVHRDIKPANLLVSYRGDRVWVLDIGLARLEWAYRDLTSSLTPTSQGVPIMGTPDYIAPEQAINPDQANIRADIYSLGCTFYHLLTGQPPFPGKSLTQKLLHHQQTPPPSPKVLRPDVPPDLAALVQKMMAKAPEDRYQTPASVAVALIRHCQGDPARWTLERYRDKAKTAEKSSAHYATEMDGTATMPDSTPPTAPVPVAPAAKPQPTAPTEPSQAAKDRRAALRRTGNPVPVLISDAQAAADPQHGWVLDRSQTGIGLLVDDPVEAGTVVSVRVDKSVPVAQRWIQVRVVYCITERSSWKLGCQFVQKLTGEEMRLFG